MKRSGFVLLTVIFGIILGGFLAEMVLRITYPGPDRYYIWPPNETLVYTPMDGVLLGVEGPVRYKSNEWGVRGQSLNEKWNHRMLVLGGSTTECVYLDQAESWPFLTQKLINDQSENASLWMGNGGKSGLMAKDHRVQMERLLGQMQELDAVLIMTGVNDVNTFLKSEGVQEDPLPVGERDLLHRSFFFYPEMMKRESLWKRTGAWQLSWRIKRMLYFYFPPENLQAEWSGEIIIKRRQWREKASAIREELPDLSRALQVYEDEIVSMVDLAHSKGVRPIFLTQPVLWSATLAAEERQLLWMGGIGDYLVKGSNEYYSTAALASAMRAYNDRLMKVCSDLSADCFDLASLVPKTKQIFFDDCHFHEKGSVYVAGLVSEYLMNLPLQDYHVNRIRKQ